MLEDIWVRSHQPGDGTFYILAGFANFNGGARFYRTFKEHTENGGKIIAVLGGSTSQRTTSRQVVEALLDCGAEVNITNRKSLMHAKCYGLKSDNGERLIVTSGNFTGPGMAQNVEAALLLNSDATAKMGFSWDDLILELLRQRWSIYRPSAFDPKDPVWQLLYDETPGVVKIDQSDELTLIVKLGRSDTARIMALPDSSSSRGTQYFWLSKDSFDFFPPLTIRNNRGYKGTLSALITLHYIDLGKTDTDCRVTFEAENNLDFRLGTRLLKNTQLAARGDLACISRIGEAEYELRIIREGSPFYNSLLLHAVNFIGHKGKQFGYLGNREFEELINTRLGMFG